MEVILNQIKNNWIVIMFFVGLIVNWTTFTIRLDAIESRVSKVEDSLDDISSIKTDIAVIKNDILYIKTQVK